MSTQTNPVEAVKVMIEAHCEKRRNLSKAVKQYQLDVDGRCMENNMIKEIQKTFRTDDVRDLVIDDEFGNVTATVRGLANTDCGFVEDYKHTTSSATYIKHETK